MQWFNIISILLVAVFFLPIIMGAFKIFTKREIQRSVGSLLDNVEFFSALLLSVYLTRRVFFDNDTSVFKSIYGLIPENIRNYLYGQDVLTYIIAVPVFLLIVIVILRILTIPLYNAAVGPFSEKLHAVMENMGSALRRIIGAVSQVPKAVCLVLIFGFALNFASYYVYSPLLSQWMNDSTVYQVLYKNAIYPVLNSNLAKQVPVIVNDSFRRTIGNILPGQPGNGNTKGNILVIEYFNGVTLEEAIKSNEQIDREARKIVGDEKNDRKKAYLLYQWVSRNMHYDYEKARTISSNPRGVSSGSVIAYETRQGVCFDYSCLYISMCRAVGVKVRLITGLGFSGVTWGDHAWNQVYLTEEKRWVNVDTTFGSAGNYFDKKDFDVDHKYAEIQGEW